ncbi:histidine phosphatase family protein [Candidatus Protochlamydia phocaeensis]|uniref:histidine phosphatase family protein n=1 Tax=Candidatus Protochlamydia phocaeensis TaxID=1414722 RepID=UPI000838C96B|nr:histidine phosphatase family protein [Candidatus Protochlamydia phocaeensis]
MLTTDMQAVSNQQSWLYQDQPITQINGQLEVTTDVVQRIYFIRHGESALNGTATAGKGVRVIQGKNLGVPLTEKGIHQAEMLAAELKKYLPSEGLYVITSSHAKRAMQTAEKIYEELKPAVHCSFGKQYPGTAEQSHGEWEGRPRDYAYQRVMDAWNTLSASEKFSRPKFEGGESPKQVRERALVDLQQMVEEYKGKTIIHVIHCNALNALALTWSGLADALPTEEGTELPAVEFANCDMLLVEMPLEGKIYEAKNKMHIRLLPSN